MEGAELSGHGDWGKENGPPPPPIMGRMSGFNPILNNRMQFQRPQNRIAYDGGQSSVCISFGGARAESC